MKSPFRALPRPMVTPVLAAFLVLLTATAEAKTSKMRDLADTVSANPILTKFAAMIQAAPDLGTFLSSRGPFTLFVPTDSAFSKLQPGMLDALLRPENKVRLEDIILFHVVNGKRLTAKDLLLLKSVLSCQGTPLPVKTSRIGTQYVNKAKITHADIRCENGIINEIDTLLMPPEASLPPLVFVSATAPTSTNLPPANEDAVTPVPVTPVDTNAAPVAPLAPPATNAP